MLLLDYKKMIVDAINMQNSTNYAYADAVFGLPHDAYTIAGADTAATNTLVRVRFGDVEYTLAYDRVLISGSLRDHQYNSRSLLRLQSVQGDPAASVAKSIQAHYGYPMDPEDIVASSIVIIDSTLIFEVSVRSYRYRKERLMLRLDTTYTLYNNDYWRQYTPARVEPEWYYEDRVDFVAVPDTAPRADMLTYGNDYTPIANVLRRFWGIQPWDPAYAYITVGAMNELAYALRSVDGLPWVFSSAAQTPGSKLNLYYSWFWYNGPIANLTPSKLWAGRVPAEQVRMLDIVDRSYTHVCILRPNSYSSLTNDKSISPSNIILHYNLPGA